MTAATMARPTAGVRSRGVRAWAPKADDPGQPLSWTLSDGTRELGTVWSAGPGAATRWVLLDGERYALVHVAQSGRHAGRVTPQVTRDREWQRAMVRALDRLAAPGARVMVSGRRPAERLRYHVSGCEHAERPATWGELAVYFPDGTVDHSSACGGAHRWLLAQLAQPTHVDRLDLCGCLTGP